MYIAAFSVGVGGKNLFLISAYIKNKKIILNKNK
jgi:hypothetical protein